MATLTLAEAKSALNLTTSAHDVELSIYLDAVDDVISSLIGPVAPTAYSEMVQPAWHAFTPAVQTEMLEPTWYAFTVAYTPLVSLTSITGAWSGESYATDGLVVQNESGVVTRPASLAQWPWEPVIVAYTAGWASVPAAAKLAGLVIIQYWWETQRASGPLSPDPAPTPGLGFAIPPRALELLAPFKLAPRVA